MEMETQQQVDLIDCNRRIGVVWFVGRRGESTVEHDFVKIPWMRQ